MHCRDDKHRKQRNILFELRDEKINGDERYNILYNYSNFVNNIWVYILILGKILTVSYFLKFSYCN